MSQAQIDRLTSRLAAAERHIGCYHWDSADHQYSCCHGVSNCGSCAKGVHTRAYVRMQEAIDA